MTTETTTKPATPWGEIIEAYAKQNTVEILPFVRQMLGRDAYRAAVPDFLRSLRFCGINAREYYATLEDYLVITLRLRYSDTSQEARRRRRLGEFTEEENAAAIAARVEWMKDHLLT